MMTNGDMIRAMPDEELAQLMAELDTGPGGVPWKAFQKAFCADCPAEPHYVKEIKRAMLHHPCDIYGSCPTATFSRGGCVSLPNNITQGPLTQLVRVPGS